MNSELVMSQQYQVELLRSLLAEIPADDRYSRDKRYETVVVQFGEEYFDGDAKTLYAVIVRFFRLTGAPISFEQFAQLLSTQAGVDEVVKLSLCQQFQQCQVGSSDAAHFIHTCDMLKETTRRDMLGRTILDAGDILLHGKKEGRHALFGYADARDFIQQQLTRIDALHMGVMPEGNLNEEARDVLAEYAGRKNKDYRQYLTGLQPVDQAAGGIQPGELWFLAGYTAEGKTSVVLNLAYYFVYVLGLNVAYATNETLRRQVRLKIVSRHSCHAKFGGMVLPYDKLKVGELSSEQEQLLQVVLADMATCKDYGRFELFQLPAKATVGYIATKFASIHQRFPLSVGVIDELRLLGSGRHRQTDREELDDIIRGTKQLATSFAGGAGLALVCPYQVSREAWKDASETGRYTKACMSNTSEAERAADGIVTVLRTETATKGQLVKYRDAGEQTNVDFMYDVRAECCFFQARSQQVDRSWLT